MSLRTTVLVATVAVAGFLALLLGTREWSLGTHPDGKARFKYLLEDVHDRGVYQQRGRWLPSGRTPYLEEHSEYPQLATWIVGLPYLFIEHHVAEGPAPERRHANQILAQDRDAYFDAFHIMVAPAVLLLIVFTALSLRSLGRNPAWALLVLCPGSLYFGFNRYDALPALVVAIAIWLQLTGRLRWAALALGVGAMIKWYPILLLPLFVAHNVHTARRIASERGQPFRWGDTIVRRAVVPGAIAGFFCLAVLGVTWIWDGGGKDAVLYVYEHHGKRSPNPASVVTALTRRWQWVPLERQEALSQVFMLLQFVPAALLALFPVRDRDTLIRGCLVVVLGFFTFSRVFSPQWVIWVTPIAALLAPRLRMLALFAVALEIVIYLQNPVLFHEGLRATARGFEISDAWHVTSAVRIGLMFTFWAWCLGGFLRTVLRAPTPVSTTADAPPPPDAPGDGTPAGDPAGA